MTAPVEMDLNERSRTTNMGFMYEHGRQGSLGARGSVKVLDKAPQEV